MGAAAGEDVSKKKLASQGSQVDCNSIDNSKSKEPSLDSLSTNQLQNEVVIKSDIDLRRKGKRKKSQQLSSFQRSMNQDIANV